MRPRPLLLLAVLVSTAYPALAGGEPLTRAAVAPAQTIQDAPPPLPRWRLGGTPYDPNRPLTPYAITRPGFRDEPTSGLIESPPEYGPMRGVLFRYFSSQWPSVVTDCVVALTKDANHDEIAYVVVASDSERRAAETRFKNGGADLSKVQFITLPGDALWIRDHGPHFIWQDGALAIVDSHYYPERTLDNFIPTLLGDDVWGLPTYDMGVYYSGGNFQPGPDRAAFMTELLNTDNPTGEGFSKELLAELFAKYQGCDTLHIMPQLPNTVDGTGHIDMWLYLVDTDTVIISKFKPGSNQRAIEITENAVGYMEDLGFEVFRTPAWNASSTHYTYTNAFRVNDRIFVPIYGPGDSQYKDEDQQALDAWQQAAGDAVEIIPINCYSIIPAAGAIHCIVMQVPRHAGPTPSVHVLWPDGGQLLLSGTTQRIRWAATDTDNVTIPQIDLYYSVDDGATYESIASTTNTGAYDWTVPTLYSKQARIKIVATSQDLDTGEAASAAAFEIAPGRQFVYDFQSGGGTDKFGWGSKTLSWANVRTKRKPVTTEINKVVQNAYDRIAREDATGGDSDVHRFISQVPGAGYESTHTFEFTLDQPADEIDDLGVRWVGYADNCTQAELYFWDYTQGDWGDGAGAWGQNRYLESWAGNRNGELAGHLRADLARFINPDGPLTLLLYAHRQNDRTFHDFVGVTLSQIRLPADVNCDAVVDFADIDAFVLALTDRAAYEAAYPDCKYRNADVNDDGAVDFNDIDAFVACLINGGCL